MLEPIELSDFEYDRDLLTQDLNGVMDIISKHVSQEALAPERYTAALQHIIKFKQEKLTALDDIAVQLSDAQSKTNLVAIKKKLDDYFTPNLHKFVNIFYSIIPIENNELSRELTPLMAKINANHETIQETYQDQKELLQQHAQAKLNQIQDSKANNEKFNEALFGAYFHADQLKQKTAPLWAALDYKHRKALEKAKPTYAKWASQLDELSQAAIRYINMVALNRDIPKVLAGEISASDAFIDAIDRVNFDTTHQEALQRLMSLQEDNSVFSLILPFLDTIEQIKYNPDFVNTTAFKEFATFIPEHALSALSNLRDAIRFMPSDTPVTVAGQISLFQDQKEAALEYLEDQRGSQSSASDSTDDSTPKISTKPRDIKQLPTSTTPSPIQALEISVDAFIKSLAQDADHFARREEISEVELDVQKDVFANKIAKQKFQVKFEQQKQGLSRGAVAHLNMKLEQQRAVLSEIFDALYQKHNTPEQQPQPNPEKTVWQKIKSLWQRFVNLLRKAFKIKSKEQKPTTMTSQTAEISRGTSQANLVNKLGGKNRAPTEKAAESQTFELPINTTKEPEHLKSKTTPTPTTITPVNKTL